MVFVYHLNVLQVVNQKENIRNKFPVSGHKFFIDLFGRKSIKEMGYYEIQFLIALLNAN